jgi:recombination protein RecT
MSEEKTTAVATAETQKAVAKKEQSIWDRLHGSWKERIERMLPEERMTDQFIYAAEVSIGKNPALGKCKPISVLNCLLTSAKYGILPDGRNAHLIPYGDDCQLQFDYKGFVHILVRDGVAKKVYCETICANDKFTWKNGEVVNHEISFPRGEILGVYCDITLPDNTHQYELMDKEEIDKIKSCSKGANYPNSPWNKFYSEMAKKSVFRRATKWVKLSPDVMDALQADNENFEMGNAEGSEAPRTIFSKSALEQEKLPTSKQQTVEVVETPTVVEQTKWKEEAKAKIAAKQELPF